MMQKLFSFRISFFIAGLMLIALFFNLRGLDCGLPSSGRTALVIPSLNLLKEITPALKETREKIYAEYEKTPGTYLAKGVIPRQGLVPAIIGGKSVMLDERKLHAIRSALLQSRFQDEQKMITSLSNINPSRMDFNPHFFQYGGVFFYAAGAAIKAAELLGFTRVTSDITYYFLHPSDIRVFFKAPKAMSGIFEILAIPLIFVLGKMLYGAPAGIFAALFLALSPCVPVESHALKPYIFFFPFMIASLIFSKKILDGARDRDYALAGIFAGLSAGTLIFTGFIGIAALCAHFLSFKNGERPGRRLFDGRLLFLATGFLTAFAATNPYWFVSFDEVKADFAFLSQVAPPSLSIKNLLYHLAAEFPKAFGYPVFLLGIAGLALSAVKFSGEDKMLLSAFIPAYFFIVISLWYFFHYSMPLVPIFLVFAGRFAGFITENIRRPALSYGFLAIVASYTLGYALFYSNIFANYDAFFLGSGRWINTNIPRGSSINAPAYPGISSGYPPFAMLDYSVNTERYPKYYIYAAYEGDDNESFSPPPNYSLIKHMSLEKGFLGKIYKRKAVIFLDPDIYVYKAP